MHVVNSFLNSIIIAFQLHVTIQLVQWANRQKHMQCAEPIEGIDWASGGPNIYSVLWERVCNLYKRP